MKIKILTLVLHMISGTTIEVNKPFKIHEITSMIKYNSSYFKSKSISLMFNDVDISLNLACVTHIETIWREKDGK